VNTYIIDTETTGNDPQECIELAYVAVGDTVIEVERFCPTKPSSYGALATHHILPLELEGCRPSKEAKLPAEASYIIGHNVDFDWRVLGEPPGLRRICTVAIARALYPEVDSHGLSAMYYRMFGALPETRDELQSAHSAAADVQLCLELLLAMLLDRAPQHSVNRPEELWKFSEQCRIPTHMTFGKHKGKPVGLVDAGWIKWYRGQPDTDPYLLQAFKNAGK
jgi:exodeoxyribonuclease X